MAHFSGNLTLLITIVTGCKAVLLSRFDAEEVLDVVEKYGVTTMVLPPFLLISLVDAQRKRARDVRSLLLCGVGGDACRQQIAEEFETTFNVQLRNVYGMTECAGSTTFGIDSRIIRAVPGRAQLVQTHGAAVPVGEIGELHVRGPNLSLGYWTAPGVIETHSHNGWFRTGDLMVRDAEDNYRFVGRRKDLIVHNASNILPAEVESELMQHTLVDDAAVAGAPDDTSGQRVVALVKLTKEGRSTKPEADEILSWIGSRIATFKVPERQVFVDTIPRNALRKIDRNEVVRLANST